MANGTPVGNASILLENMDSGYRQQVTTDPSGAYTFTGLPSGRYRITPSTAQLTGTPSDPITFDAQRGKTVDATMQTPTGPVTTAATNIVDSQTSLDMTTPDIRYPRNTHDVVYLPQPNYIEQNGQAYGAYNLSLLDPGVTTNNSLGPARGPVVGGQRPVSNNFYVDGMDNNNRGWPGPLVYVPNDATAEFVAYHNQFAPEFGHAIGGQFDSIIKTGSNGFHGELYDYLMNRNLNAMDASFARQGIRDSPGYDQNRLGANAGFAIIPSKLYFFGDFEWIPLHYDAIPGFGGIVAPTAAGYATLSGMSGISATNLGVLQANVPAATAQTTFLNVGGTAIPAGYSPAFGSFRQDSYVGVGALDWDATDSDHVHLRFDANDVSNNTGGATLPQFYTPVRDRSLVSNLSWYHNFSPLFVNELRVGYTRFDSSLGRGAGTTFPGLTAFPNISILDTNLSLGPGLLETSGLNTYQGADNMSFTFGRHQVRVGYDYRRFIGPLAYGGLGAGSYAYSSLAGFLQDLTPDITAQRTFGNAYFTGNNWDEYAFANDHWQVSPNFTLDLGVTYSYVSVPNGYAQQRLLAGASVPGTLTFRSPSTQNTNFAPIVGIAFSPGFVKNTVFRAGFGMNYDTTYYNSIFPVFPGAFTQYAMGGATPAGGFFGSGAIMGGTTGSGTGTGAATPQSMVTSYVPNQRVPYSMQWNAGIEQSFGRFVLDVRYLGVKSVHLPTEGFLNQVSPVSASQSLPVYFTAPSQATLDSLTTTLASLQATSTNPLASAGFTNPISTFYNNGWSWYNGLQVRASQRFSGGFQFQASYTWSHLFDNLSGPLYSFPWTTTAWEIQTPSHTSVYDHRQNASLTALWDMGALGGHSFNFVRDVLTNFHIGGTYTYETQPYLPIFSGANTGLTAFNGVGGGVFTNPGGAAGIGTGVTPLMNSSGQVVAYQANNPNAGFAAGAPGTFSTSNPRFGFNPINNFDMMAIKAFGIRDKIRLELRGDAYNVFNHPQFTLSNPHDIGTMNLGLVNLLNPASAAFANPGALLPSNARTLQVAMKLTW